MNKTPPLPHLAADIDAKQSQGHFSKWITFDVLLDPSELTTLFQALPKHFILKMNAPKKEGEHLIDPSFLIEQYQNMIAPLKKGQSPNFDLIKKHLYLCVTAELSTIALFPLPNSLWQIKLQKPNLLIKPVSLYLSKVDQSLKSGLFNPDALFWGMRFAFPTLYQEPVSMSMHQLKDPDYPNSELFKLFRSFLRQQTKAASFLMGSQKKTSTARIGRACQSWIEFHPQINHLELKVI